MEIGIGDVVRIANHQYLLDSDIGTVVDKLGGLIDVCVHNAYGPDDSFIAVVKPLCVVEILRVD